MHITYYSMSHFIYQPCIKRVKKGILFAKEKRQRGWRFMENNVLNGMDRVDPSLRDEMLAELFLNQVMNDFKRSKILEKVDQSLKNKDKEAFLRLTEELKSVS